MPPDSDAWRVTTDRARIRQWAEKHHAVPVRDDDAPGETSLAIVPDPASGGGAGLADAEQITWDQFFELFEADGLAFRYREADADEGAPVTQLVDRTEVTESAPAAGGGAEEVASDRIATSDTGDAEPVVEDRVESDTGLQPSERGSQTPRRTGGRQSGAKPNAGEERSEAARSAEGPDSPESEAASGAEAGSIVLEEIYEDPGFDSDPEDEYVVLRNDSGERVELGGWRVENDLGRRYEFPDGFVLGPSEEVTLHSGHGEDGDTDLYWGADEPVWDEQGGVVVVRTADGRRVVREPYKDG